MMYSTYCKQRAHNICNLRAEMFQKKNVIYFYNETVIGLNIFSNLK